MTKHAVELSENDAGRAALIGTGLSLYNGVPADIAAVVNAKKDIYKQLQNKSVANINAAYKDKLSKVSPQLEAELDAVNKKYWPIRDTLTGEARSKADAEYNSEIKRLEETLGKERANISKEQARAVSKAKSKNMLMTLRANTEEGTRALKNIGKYGVLPAGLYLAMRRMYNPKENARIVQVDNGK